MLILNKVLAIGIAGSGKPTLVATTGRSARLNVGGVMNIFTGKQNKKIG